ncbi:TPA: prepilin-type N-terminal cleavage/methylation domain-containing protein [Candidatus Avigastranaerophilus faecigallinarum]|nr:prepilin-type N-terminal cleavage/methylation domain-containing protein [Candidatus Avigastranaerophilus faecigallinarum]
MRKAFTLSEALITLAIIGVLAAILIPVIDNVRPDKDKITYKKALYSMQSAISNAMDSTLYSMAANSSAYWKDENVGDSDFCDAVADALNTAGKVDCIGPSSYVNPNFITTDGIRYWGLEGKFDGDTRTIYVDRGLGTKELKTIAAKRGKDGDGTGLQIRVRYDGKIDTPESTDSENFDFENELIENSLQVTAGKMK